MPIEQFVHTPIPPEAESLREQVRDFLADAIADRPAALRAQSWNGYDAEFSRKLGERGWLGMAMPKKYGGHEMGAFARYVVIEELLAAGAPVSAHWIAERQSAPLILRYGTEEQRQRYLPGICAGETYACIGMSEPNSGSDLASIGSRARKVGEDWILNGQKIWTTNAHRSHYMIGLVRTRDATEQRHAGMSQFMIDLSLPGITVRPIRDLTGGEHFNEVFFDDVNLGPDAMVGQEGAGWTQVMAELAFERSGPERFLSSMTLLHTLIDAVGPEPNALQAKEIGRIIARIATLRQMSLAVTAQLDAGGDPTWGATCVKDIGTGLEQELPEIAHALLDIEPTVGGGPDHAQVLAYLTQLTPSFSLRGGTREILREILARGLGLR
jgi:alkylation response protein AidB-like acyl-CoA dehydrogenase